MRRLAVLALAMLLVGCAAHAQPLSGPTGSGWGSRLMCYHLCAGPNGRLRA